MKPVQLYASKKRDQDIYGNIFGERSILINDILIMQTNSDYSFLKKIKAPNKSYFVYCVCDTQQRIIKLGKTMSPFKRISDHVNNFICYGGSSVNDLFCIWSRHAFHEDSNIEKQLLNQFRESSVGACQIGQEFFSNIHPISAESLFCSFVNDISYKKYE